MDGEGWTSIRVGNALIIDADALGSMEENNRELITDLPGSCKSMDGEGLTSMNEEDSTIEDNNRELIMGICVLSNCESVDDRSGNTAWEDRVMIMDAGGLGSMEDKICDLIDIDVTVGSKSMDEDGLNGIESMDNGDGRFSIKTEGVIDGNSIDGELNIEVG